MKNNCVYSILPETIRKLPDDYMKDGIQTLFLLGQKYCWLWKKYCVLKENQIPNIIKRYPDPDGKKKSSSYLSVANILYIKSADALLKNTPEEYSFDDFLNETNREKKLLELWNTYFHREKASDLKDNEASFLDEIDCVLAYWDEIPGTPSINDLNNRFKNLTRAIKVIMTAETIEYPSLEESLQTIFHKAWLEQINSKLQKKNENDVNIIQVYFESAVARRALLGEPTRSINSYTPSKDSSKKKKNVIFSENLTNGKTFIELKNIINKSQHLSQEYQETLAHIIGLGLKEKDILFTHS